MLDYQRHFIQLAIDQSALKFGQFTLKSGRISPYFFNSGEFNTGASLSSLSECYAAAIGAAQFDFDVIFGPAYKGIPLVVATAMVLAKQRGESIPYCFNRKEVKDHGEGGILVGSALAGKKVLVIDDTITAGTALNEAMTMIKVAQGKPVAAILALDRQERAPDSEQSALEQASQTHGIQISSIAKLDTLIEYMTLDTSGAALKDELNIYRQRYGINA